MDIKEIQELIKIFDKSNLGELGIERNDFKINLKTKERETIVTTVSAAPVAIQTAPVAAPQVAAAPAPVAAVPVADKGTVIKAPMVGTFYRSAGPDKPAFVKPGDKVKKGQVICIIEAMKLFNEIECEMDGTIVKVVADDASPVEFDQPLFVIE
ncbi:MAG: acetyl-CoA carboxylase biotin carboxyl carrier protein [Bacteroidota bacterium]|jgi:acetyl-CoA carboxylase biotin carboxyl carrier protein